MPRITVIILLFILNSYPVYSENQDTSNDTASAGEVITKPEEPAFSIQKIFSYKHPQKKGTDEKKWFYTLSGWYSRKTGNTDTLVSNFGTGLKRDDNISDFKVSVAGFYDETDGERNTKKCDGFIKYDRYIIPRIELFVFSKSEYNKMMLLDHRSNSGAGAKYIFVKSEFLKLDLSAALIYQFENYEGERPDADYRWSFRFRAGVYPLKGLEFSYVYFYIPKIDDRKIYRTELETYMSYKINDYLSFKVGYNNQYNREALSGTKKTDENVYAQFSLHL